MSQLEKWLQRHELVSIAELLKSHDVTLDVPPDLTEQDLRELGLSWSKAQARTRHSNRPAGPKPATGADRCGLSPGSQAADGDVR
jgi:SAM domain (Sterile alpha motif)